MKKNLGVFAKLSVGFRVTIGIKRCDVESPAFVGGPASIERERGSARTEAFSGCDAGGTLVRCGRMVTPATPFLLHGEGS